MAFVARRPGRVVGGDGRRSGQGERRPRGRRLARAVRALAVTAAAALAVASLPSCAAESITSDGLRARILDKYLTVEDAFAALAGNSSAVGKFVFLECLAHLKQPVVEDQARFAFALIDVDHNGSITPEEWAQIFRPERAAGVTMSVDTWLEALEMEVGPTFSWNGWLPFAFGLLHHDQEGGCSPNEFLRATQRFKTPLTKEQASSVFFQLDRDHDSKISRHELQTAAERLINCTMYDSTTTLAEYKRRLSRGVAHTAGIEVRVRGAKASLLNDHPHSTSAAERIIVLSLSQWFGVDLNDVHDERGQAGHVSLSNGPHGLIIRAAVKLPASATGVVDISEGEALLAQAVQTHAAQLAHDLTEVPQLTDEPLTFEDIEAVGLSEPWVVFVVARLDDDGVLDRNEFKDVVTRFKEPLTAQQASFVFTGLDADFNGKLTTEEFAALGLSRFVKAPFMGRQLPFNDFIGRVLQKYSTPQDAFDMMSRDQLGQLTFDEFCRSLTNPLSGDQAKWAFVGLDVNANGVISNKEFLEVVKFGDFGPSSSEVASLFQFKLLNAVEALPPMPTAGDGSLALALSGYLVGCFLLRVLFMTFRLPGGLGVMLFGALAQLFGFFPSALVSLEQDLRRPAAFVFLFVGGFGVSFSEMTLGSLIRSTFPVVGETLGVALYGVVVLELPVLQALLLGSAVCGVGEAPAVMKMRSFGQRFEQHPLPRLVASWLPIETCQVLVQWGILSIAATLSMGRSGDPPLGGEILLSALASLFAGTGFGGIMGMAVSMRTRLPFGGAFSGSSAEAAVLVAGATLAGVAMHHIQTLSIADFLTTLSGGGVRVVASPELAVIACAAALANVLGVRDLAAVDMAVSGLWLVAQLVIFGSFGAAAARHGWHATKAHMWVTVQIMAVGLSMRFLGLLLSNMFALAAPPCACPKCRRLNRTSLMSDTAFCFLASMPRTSLQACFGMPYGSVAAALHHPAPLAGLVPIAARFYVVFCSVVGSFLLEFLGHSLLSAGLGTCELAQKAEEQRKANGWTARQRTLLGSAILPVPTRKFRIGVVTAQKKVADFPMLPAYPAKHAVDLLAKAYLVDPQAYQSILQSSPMSARTGDSPTDSADPFASSTSYSGYASVRDMEAYHAGPVTETESAFGKTMPLPAHAHPAGTIARRLAEPSLPPMSLLEAFGQEQEERPEGPQMKGVRDLSQGRP